MLALARFSTRWLSPILVVLAAVLSVAGNAQGQGTNTYTVTGVEVDAGGADAVQARQQGLAEARRKAARMLIERLVAPEDRAKVAVPEAPTHPTSATLSGRGSLGTSV